MSVLGAVNLDFIALLQRQVKNWTITPVVAGKWQSMHWWVTYLIHRQPPLGQSYLDLYYEQPPQQTTFNLIKIPGRIPRALQLTLIDQEVHIEYWRAYGWKQTFVLESERGNQCIPDITPDEIAYRIKPIVRITRRSKKRPWQIEHEIIHLTHHSWNKNNLPELVTQVILKSYDARGLAHRSEQERYGIGVNLDGPNLEYDDWNNWGKR